MGEFICRNKNGLKIIQANEMYLYTEDNRRIIDGCSNSMNVNYGYSQPELTDLIIKQHNKLPFMHDSKAITNESMELCKDLLDIFDKDNQYSVFITSNGSDCIEAALRITTLYHKNNMKKNKFMSFDGSYHGSSLGALSVTGHEDVRNDFTSIIPHVDYLPTDFENFNKSSYNFSEVSAIVLDSFITNSLGCKEIKTDYLFELQNISYENNIITIYDEIATSCGRLGSNFGFDDKDISPDIICISKGLGIGFTNIGAVFVKRKIFDYIEGYSVLGNTFNANPISCVVAKYAINEYKKIKNMMNYGDTHRYLYERLSELLKYPFVKKISGKGLMYSVHIEKLDANKINELCLKNGVLLLSGSSKYSNHITICPRLNSGFEEIDEIVNIVNKTFEEVIRNGKSILYINSNNK